MKEQSGKVTLYNGKTWVLHPRLKQNLDILLTDVKNSSMDLVIVVDGPEGLGKSFAARGLAMYCATVLGSTFGVKDIEFELEDYIKHSLEAGSAKKTGIHKINVLDESRKVLNRARGGSNSNVQFTNFLSECRALGQVHILLCPAFHDLDKYIILWRMGLLIHFNKNYKPDEESETGVSLFRGEYKVFINSSAGRKALYTCYDMRQYSYPYKWEVRGIWSNKEVFTPEQIEAYEEKKNDSTIKKYYADEEAKQIEQAEEEALEEELQRTIPAYVPTAVYAKLLGITTKSTVNQIKNGHIKGFQKLKKWYVSTEELPPELKEFYESHTEKFMKRTLTHSQRKNLNLKIREENNAKNEVS